MLPSTQVDYFKRMALKEEIFAPLRLTGKPLEWDVWCTVKGGGFSGQAGAIRHGVAQALQAFDIEKYRPLMKRYKLLTFDCRQVERKKPGQPKARKKFQVRPCHPMERMRIRECPGR